MGWRRAAGSRMSGQEGLIDIYLDLFLDFCLILRRK